jgi:hypothetical protein
MFLGSILRMREVVALSSAAPSNETAHGVRGPLKGPTWIICHIFSKLIGRAGAEIVGRSGLLSKSLFLRKGYYHASTAMVSLKSSAE